MADEVTLIGRAVPLAAVTEAIRARRAVVVAGQAGIGKTSVVRAAAARSGRGLRAGGGFATLSWLPYLALRRAVDLGEARDPAQVVATVRRAVGGDVLFVDDLQWADEETREVVDLLLAGRRGAPGPRLAVAVREGEPGADATIAGIASKGALVVRLERLDGRAALALAGRSLPGAPGSDLRRLVGAADGNPLLLEELAAHGEAPSWLLRALGRSIASPPPSVGSPAPVEAVPAATGRLARVEPVRSLDRRVAELAAGIAHGRLNGVAAASEALLAEPLTPRARRRTLAVRGLALALLGQAEEAEPNFTQAARIDVRDADAAASGDPQEAGALAETWAEASLWGGLPKRALDQLAHVDGAPTGASLTRAWAEVELGRRPTPSALAPRSDGSGGASEELEGLRALADERLAAASAAFDAAASRWANRHEPRRLVCRWAAAEARRRAGDDRALAQLRSTLEAATAIGFEALAARLRRSMRLAGERLAPPREARRAGDPLTPRERQVLELVERGRTNLEIARRMGLGRPTVARILSNAMLKLGAQSRTHAVVLAAGPRVPTTGGLRPGSWQSPRTGATARCRARAGSRASVRR